MRSVKSRVSDQVFLVSQISYRNVIGRLKDDRFSTFKIPHDGVTFEVRGIVFYIDDVLEAL